LPVSLPGALTLDITLEFEAVTDLTLVNAGLSAAVVSPLDAGLVGRLPDSVISIPAEFPVLVLVEPPGVGLTTLAFDGIYTLTLLTPNLPYYPGTRLRMFTAHDGGDFEDITRETSKGSYRVRGSGGEFSEFLIALDTRHPEAIVDAKLTVLQALLTGYSGAIDATVFASLQSLLDSADTLWQKRNVNTAIAELDNFTAAIVAATSVEIPDSWAATGGPDNIAGILRGKAATLRFSMVETITHTRDQ
ncbi:MAG: hypothetical protein HKN70_08720, partial [Gammaproteobacteria bacterium]|nr:hypothetical protein [Gammaproteobacteria bacterium]